MKNKINFIIFYNFLINLIFSIFPLIIFTLVGSSFNKKPNLHLSKLQFFYFFDNNFTSDIPSIPNPPVTRIFSFYFRYNNCE